MWLCVKAGDLWFAGNVREFGSWSLKDVIYGNSFLI